MIRPRVARLQARVLAASWCFCSIWSCAEALAQATRGRTRDRRPASSSRSPSRSPTRRSPASARRRGNWSTATRRPSKGTRPILVFEFLPGDTAPGTSEFGVCYDLASLISKELAGAKLTVAYVPQPLTGLCRLARGRLHRDRDGVDRRALGPITPEGQPFDAALREPVRFLAMRKTRDPDLLLGMLDRDADLRLVRTADKAVHYVLADNMKEFRQDTRRHRRSARLGGRPARGADRRAGARGRLLQADRREPRRGAPASTRSAANRRSKTRPWASRSGPVWIKLEGPLDTVMVSYLTRSIEQARQEKKNLLILADQQPGRHRDGRRPTSPTCSRRSRT